MPVQLVFDWPTGVALGPEDFFVSDANRKAVEILQNPDTWPEQKLVIVGPSGAGKSHLTKIFEHAQNAQLLSATALPTSINHDSAIVVEDMERLPEMAEEQMFHLHNNQRAAGFPLLMTAAEPPSRWNIGLPDLESRMTAATAIAIDQPDDELLQVLLTKLFADRQVIPSHTVINYLVTRIDRSYTAAADIVARIDYETMVTKKPASTRMAAQLLDNS